MIWKRTFNIWELCKVLGSQKEASENHFHLSIQLDAQRFFTENPRELFAERVIDAALVKLFNLD